MKAPVAFILFLVLIALMGYSEYKSKQPKEEDVEAIQDDLAWSYYISFLGKYGINKNDYGLREYVFNQYSYKKSDNNSYTFNPDTNIAHSCKNKISINKDDLQREKESLRGFIVKSGVKVDVQSYNDCLKNGFNSIPLTSEDLEYMANDPLILAYKENNTIRNMISKAKEDNNFSQLELMDIYLTAYYLKKNDLYNSL
ncbi:hypothetical protein R4576_18145 [Acinetobacter baumannii]|nr:hypothetical protein [Acinetobacter baumannii]